MNERLRKKRRVGEFKELGFELLGELPPGTNWDSAAIACEESLVSEYQEGTLIIDIYDAAKKELVWHGWKSRKSLPSDSPELPGVVEQATVDILSNFPPG